jgi:O-succinylhomoserine sulfhydrylase
MNDRPAAAADEVFELETRLVHCGTLRSDFAETSEALFLTQGHVYETAEQCEARFKGEDPGYIYARFSNPTVGMFEARMARSKAPRRRGRPRPAWRP